MYKNKTADGRNNICGRKIRLYRLALPEKTSQRILAERMQVYGIDLDKNAIQKIEAGHRFVTDIELKVFAEFFGVTCEDLIEK